MKVSNYAFKTDGSTTLTDTPLSDAQLVLYFGAPGFEGYEALYKHLEATYPQAAIAGCTGGGAIQGDEICDDAVVVSAVQFKTTKVRLAERSLIERHTCFSTGVSLAQELNADDLKAILVFSEGLNTNGVDLTDGLIEILPKTVVVAGGLSSDGGNLMDSRISNHGKLISNGVVAIGFYGADFVAASAAVGGWSPFGPVRAITKATDNVLFELDGKPALDLYETYLGDEAKNLPASALIFPLGIINPELPEAEPVRSVIDINRQQRSLTLTIPISVGHNARLMRATNGDLTDGAENAALFSLQQFLEKGYKSDSFLSVLISCIGRRIMMGQDTISEVEAAADILGPAAQTIGFYSHGEIGKHPTMDHSSFHNQTMSVTLFAENE